MTTKFIQPVSMRVTEEQYERDLRQPLLAMGYEEKTISDFDLSPILTNNYDDIMGVVSNTDEDAIKTRNRHYIPDYNPEYFLAVAAMTNVKLGCVGEWFIYNGEDSYDIKNGEMCMITKRSGVITNIKNERGDTFETHISYWHSIFTKATLSDLINKFEYKTNKNTQIIWN